MIHSITLYLYFVYKTNFSRIKYRKRIIATCSKTMGQGVTTILYLYPTMERLRPRILTATEAGK